MDSPLERLGDAVAALRPLQLRLNGSYDILAIVAVSLSAAFFPW
jgi:hypothetical protein